ncbi:glutamate 5-kinase [Candidatus Woesearchaeota archaeon]|nr:glutamate 5-kinase [Candidatus Woesearchaeota archaeon]
MREQFKECKRIVIKIGTHTITQHDGTIDQKHLEHLIQQIVRLKQAQSFNRDVVVVSSGAVGAGMMLLNMNKRPRILAELQACAAVGQGHLMHLYEMEFQRAGMHTAQLLLAEEDFTNRERYLNFRNTLQALFARQVIPVVNENDPVATHELKLGDNDTLAAYVATNINADLLIMLSDIEGLYDRNPKEFHHAKLVPEVCELNTEVENFAGKKKTSLGVGGMKTKINAARICMQSGVHMIIAKGKQQQIITDIVAGKAFGTLFVAQKKIASRERWILFTKPKGVLIIDDGAKNALFHQKSLLPSGIKDVKGTFQVGDLVSLQTSSLMNSEKKDVVIGQGLVEYAVQDIVKIKGKQTKEIPQILGYAPSDAIVRKENLVLHDPPKK